MRSGGTFNTTTSSSSSSSSSNFTSVAKVPTSPWHSPVPYLFGGLAAMLGLIAFALLILACSYWKLSGNMDNNEGDERDPENGEEKSGEKSPYPVYEEKIVVIMAGDEKPTFLATPMSSRASSFGTTSSSSSSSSSYQESEKLEKSEKDKEENHLTDEGTQVEEESQNRATQADQSENRETQG